MQPIQRIDEGHAEGGGAGRLFGGNVAGHRIGSQGADRRLKRIPAETHESADIPGQCAAQRRHLGHQRGTVGEADECVPVGHNVDGTRRGHDTGAMARQRRRQSLDLPGLVGAVDATRRASVLRQAGKAGDRDDF